MFVYVYTHTYAYNHKTLIYFVPNTAIGNTTGS